MLSSLSEEIRSLAKKSSISLTDNELQQFELHANLLEAWSRTMNLTSIHSPDEMAKRHFLEGIVAGDWLRRNSSCGPLLDLGSGNGFPAIPMAVVCVDARPIILIESSEKKAAFLRALLRELGWEAARVEVRHVKKSGDLADLPCRIFTTRGVSVSKLLEEGLTFLEMGGHCVLFGSKSRLGIESSHLSNNFVLEDEIQLPGREAGIVILTRR
jgi:16S rRNA (guanine527-N7)-methyltransferase